MRRLSNQQSFVWVMAIGLLISSPVAASRINEVTVYDGLARVRQQVNIKLKTPRAKMVLADLPPTAVPGTLRVECKTAEVSRVQVAKVPTARAKKALSDAFRKRRAKISQELASISDQQKILTDERAYIRRLQIARPPTKAKANDLRVDVAAWQQILRWQEQRSKQIAAKLREFKARRVVLNNRLAALNVEARKQKRPSRTGLSRQVSAMIKGAPRKHRLTVSYLVRDASWRPAYDLHYDPQARRVRATFYAETAQRSGEDWLGAKMRFSTIMPTQKLAVAKLSAWTLGRRRDFTPKPLPYRERVLVRARLNRDFRGRGNFSVDGAKLGGRAGLKSGKFKSAVTGYKYRNDNADGEQTQKPTTIPSGQSRIVLRKPPHNIAPVEEPADESRPEPPAAKLSPGRWRRRSKPRELLPWHDDQGGQAAGNLTRAAQGYRFMLYAPGRHSLPATRERRRIPVLRMNLAVEPIHRIAPGRTKNVYVVGEVKNTTGRPLLRGRANLFSGKTYRGTSWLNTFLPGKMIRLPLGVDDKVKVSRQMRQHTATEGVFVKDDATNYVVEIRIANHHAYPITVDLSDQVPVARGKDVSIRKVRFLSAGRPVKGLKPSKDRQRGWSKPDDQGRVKWVGTVKPGVTTRVAFQFQIVRPKDWRLRQQGG